ncbi:MAG: lysophospholipid acyltransferase family protein [Catalinimonas sp.]
MLKTLSRLPWSVAYALADALAFVAHRPVGYRKQVVLSNLRRSFPNADEEELRRTARAFYRNLADVTIETLKSLTLTEKALRRRVALSNPEDLIRAAEVHGGALIMTPHQCNWEWLLLRYSLELPLVLAVYRPLHSPFADRLMRTIRARFGATPVPDRQLPRALATHRRRVTYTALVADQTPSPKRAYWTEFMHQDTPFFRGTARLARTTGHPVFFARMERVRRGHYVVHVEPLATPPYGEDTDWILDRFVAATEATIRTQPEAWLWSHRRWKHHRPR